MVTDGEENRLGAFLRARRELVTPEQAGIPAGTNRRVPGLRREEVALLASISADYYLRLERGRDRNPSPQVLDALARVLLLDDVERDHLVGDVADVLRRRTPGEDEAEDWLQWARDLESTGREVQDFLGEGQRSLRWNPRQLLVRRRPSLEGHSELAECLAATGEHIRSIVNILRSIGDGTAEAEPEFLRRYGEFLAQMRQGIEALTEIDPERLDRERSGLERENARAREVLDELVESDAEGEIEVYDDRVRGGLLLEAQRLMAEMQAAEGALTPSESHT